MNPGQAVGNLDYAAVAARLAADKEAAEKAKAASGTPPAEPVKVAKRTFYSRLDGNTYICKGGHVCRFENGQYHTEKQEEIDELEALLKIDGQFLICGEPVFVNRTDAKIMHDVGGNQGQRALTGGPVSSAGLAGMVR